MKVQNSNTLSRVLYVDLTKKSFWVKDRTDLLKYIGGTGIAINLLLEECPEGIDPFDPENPIIFAVGPLTGVYPLASKTIAMFKSPLTGNLGESHAGGRSATSIRMAGYGAIVIKGKSEIPIYISIDHNKVQFKNATTIWGMSSSMTAGKIIRENEKGHGCRTIMRIGKAGENLISYAAVTTETYRHFGRTGLGAVFGSKMLKGVVVNGNSHIPVADVKKYKAVYDEIYNSAVDTSLMKKYHDLGTAENIRPLNILKALPIKNLLESSNPEADKIGGEVFAEKHLGRRVACSHCPVGCIHLANLREVSDHEAYFYKTTAVGYDFELIYALGSMIGVFDPEHLMKIIDLVEVYGLDAMSTGVVLSWITEMYEKKKITVAETDGVEPKWGDCVAYLEMIKKIVHHTNDFYKAAAKGVDYASGVFGGKEFALAFGKNEMPGYHTGPAGYLGFMLGARHSHLDNAGYSLDQKELIHNAVEPEKIIDKLIAEEEFRQVLSSIVICFFARNIYSLEMTEKALSTLGIETTAKELAEVGKEIYKLKYKFKFREGFRFENQIIPDRLTETPEPTGKLTKEYIQRGLDYATKVLNK